MNATTPEVVELMRKHDFNLTGAQFDGGTTSALHWAVTDAQGRSAIIEFDKGTSTYTKARTWPSSPTTRLTRR